MSRRNTIQLHGALRSAFHGAMSGRNLLRLSFLPKKKTLITYLLWGATLCMVVLIGLANAFVTYQEWLFAAGACCMPIFFLLAEMAIHRGVSVVFADDAVVGSVCQQPWKLRRPIIRYAFMRDALRRQGVSHTIDELHDCLESISISRDGRPPGMTGFLRHPLVVSVFSLSIYTVSLRLGSSAGSVAGWSSVAGFLFTMVLLLWIGLTAYFLRYVDPSEEWHFECCIRWYCLEGRAEFGHDAFRKNGLRAL